MKATYIEWDSKEQRLTDALVAIFQNGVFSPSLSPQYHAEIARRALVDVGYMADSEPVYTPKGRIDQIQAT